jgi:hypothetical protein
LSPGNKRFFSNKEGSHASYCTPGPAGRRLLFLSPGRAGRRCGKEKSADKPDPAAAAVEKVLRAEVAGAVDRRAQLAETLRLQPDSAAARWQGGFIKVGNSWRSFDESPRGSDSGGLLEEYRRGRDDAPKTFPAQLDLANWCRKQGLKDLERVHLLVALSLNPEEEQPALLQRLGYTQIGNQWVSAEQRRDWQSTIRQAESSLKKWSAKLERIAERLGGSKAQHDAALSELRAIDDRSAIPAIEFVLAGRNERTAGAAMLAMGKTEGPEAALALARQGVFSPWPAIRKLATASLKERPFEDFVPSLIALLATPAQGVYRVDYDPSQGALVHSYMAAIETENQFEIAKFNVISRIVTVETSLLAIYETQNSTQGRLAAGDSARTRGDGLYAEERQRGQLNERIQVLNDRIVSVLAELSGAEPTSDVRKWWQWWYDFTDAPPAGTKPIVVVSETEVASTTPTLIPLIHSSCFAAGTLVWTETGAVPIETIKVGDRVLAQEIGSGELAYKPVLVTTVNPPRDLLAMRVGDESIVCTKGHRFWTSGSGWMKARDLAPQTLLHTVTGNTAVWSVRPAPAEKTYNLIVDGFHTYFVGKSAILCQDLRSSNGANCLVPGLRRENAVAQTANK